ncbi:depupylase/deamidase Dop [Actinomyces sp. oral taxon 170]|uniref:depupylase/deamidase Dop n=1 Tax=Actinomyces sp. oral taxon 170 TaxID=712117 RepID=UPI000205C7C3|nr:depupylase/deamidase Dop [Actinomyces sp. oral taxon 170]EGF53626.1 proteasome accessory factor PafA2 [Actinomyces sp. oral taxon 170 str. F0386]
MSDGGFQPGPVRRPIGLETEFGVLRPDDPYANPVVLSSQMVEAYCTAADVPAVRWDYEGEDPLADLRGGRIQRSAAHPSQLTDDPTCPAPSGDAPPPAPWGSRARPGAAEAALPRATTAVLVNGARLYVDHAHPEYSSPEVLTPHDAVIWDRAGEVVARRAMTALSDGGSGAGAAGAPVEVVLYKNNVDGKGAAYGSHENYLVRRELPFEELAAVLTPFLITRPVLVGAGRVGIGQRSERPGFQISQRADYVESEIGLQTTFNRPIINTRDEPHADDARWRRLHVINGDANRFDVPIYLKVATTDLLVWLLEQAHAEGSGVLKDTMSDLGRLAIIGDPVEEHWAVSHDPTLSYELTTQGGAMSALAIQRAYLEIITPVVKRTGEREAQRALLLWGQILDALEQWRSDGSGPAAQLVEWVAKYELCEGMRRRSGTGWDDPRLAALDIQWADLRPGRSVVDKLDAAGRIHRLVTEAEVQRAADVAPEGTRATIRGTAINRYPQIVSASWTCLVLDVPGAPDLLRLRLPDDVAVGAGETATILEEIGRRAAPARD